MRYICLVHFDPTILEAMPDAARADFDRRTFEKDQELHDQGRLVHAEAIEGGHAAKLVRVRNGRVSVTDGPYMETKEQMGGFVLFEARDLNEAIASFDGDPMADIGTLEIRPIFEIPVPPPLE